MERRQVGPNGRALEGKPLWTVPDHDEALLDLGEHYEDYGQVMYGLMQGFEFRTTRYVYRKMRLVESLVSRRYS